MPKQANERQFLSEIAILCLFKVPGQSMDWYWKKIAGVPFILRNILSLQRGGINHLLVYTKMPGEIDERLMRDICSDSRVQLKLQWIFEPKQLAESARGDGDLLIFDGSALHSQAEVAATLKEARGLPRGTDGSKIFIFSLQDKILSRFLEDIDNFSSTLFEKILNDDINSDFVGHRRKLIFIPGPKESLIESDNDFIAQQNLLLEACGLDCGSFMGRWVTSSMSRLLTRLFLKISLTPQLMVPIGFIMGLCSAWFFYSGNYGYGVLGALMLIVSTWIASAGNEVCRLEFMDSKTGSRLNRICGNMVHAWVFFSIGMGAYNTTGKAMYPLLGGLSALGLLIASISGPVVKNKTQWFQRVLMGKVAYGDFTYLLLLMALIDQMGIFIMIAAIGANLYAGFLLHAKIWPSLMPVNEDPA
ncbi:MAG: hypothetical protein A3K09_00950 [Nitrospinae bacterium RIFCSPLOWO2_12_FULL_47_7]|nr:MAG: hypothetical protein A3K09_00950 [Nitrospinae bacterium RIFCSPLOWO2_12_FULL_47_7]